MTGNRPKYHKAFWFLTLLGLMSGMSSFMQLQVNEYSLKAAFVYRFLDYIEWNSSNVEDVDIAILGESDIYTPLVQISEQSSGRSIKIRQCGKLDEIGQSRIVFVSKNCKIPTEDLISMLTDKPALIITEKKDDFDKGGHINFKISGNKLKFEVNLKDAARAGFRISSNLLQHAEKVKQ